jgi:hypothetical protein
MNLHRLTITLSIIDLLRVAAMKVVTGNTRCLRNSFIHKHHQFIIECLIYMYLQLFVPRQNHSARLGRGNLLTPAESIVSCRAIDQEFDNFCCVAIGFGWGSLGERRID